MFRLNRKFEKIVVALIIVGWVYAGFPYPYFDNERGEVALKHSVEEAQAALPTTISTITIAPQLTHAGPFLSSGGNVYYVGRSSDSTAAVRVVKATDPTASFATAATDTATGLVIGSLDVKQNGDDLHILAAQSGRDITYHRFSMASDTFTRSRTVITTTSSSNVPHSDKGVTIGRRSDGDLIAIYSGDFASIKGNLYSRIRAKVSTDNGATWGTEFEYSNGGSGPSGVEVHYRRPSCEIGDSDTLHCVYAQDTNLMQRAMSSADAMQTERDTAVDVPTPGSANLSIGKGATFSRSATTRLRFPFREVTTLDTRVLRFDAAADPSVFAADTVDGTNDQKANGNSQLALDGSTVHAMWSRAADSDLYTDTDEDTDTWNSAASTRLSTLRLTTRATSPALHD